MALAFIEGFDDGMFLMRWSASTTSTAVISTSAGRTGPSALRMVLSSATHGSLTRNVAEHGTVTVGTAFKRSPSSATDTPARNPVQLRNGTTIHLSVMLLETEVRLYLATTLLASVAASIPNDVWVYVELSAVIADTGGRGIVRLNGQTIIDFTGDTRNGTTSTVNNVLLHGSTTSLAPYHFDDIYVTDGSGTSQTGLLGDLAVETLYPNGDGAASQLLGSDGDRVSNHLLVSENPPDDATFVGSAVIGERDLYALGNLSKSGTVHGVQVTARGAKSDAGSRSARTVVLSGTTEVLGPVIGLADGPTLLTSLYPTDPATGAAWTAAGVNGLQAGFQIAG